MLTWMRSSDNSRTVLSPAAPPRSLSAISRAAHVVAPHLFGSDQRISQSQRHFRFYSEGFRVRHGAALGEGTMTQSDDTVDQEPNRRAALKSGLMMGGAAVVWAVPAVTSLTVSPAFAEATSPPPGRGPDQRRVSPMWGGTARENNGRTRWLSD